MEGLVLIFPMMLRYCFRISAVLTGFVLAVLFGNQLLDILSVNDFQQILIDIAFYVAVLYFALVKPNGDFLRKYLWEYRNIAIFSNLLFIVASLIYIYFYEDFIEGFIILLAFGVVAVSSNSIAFNFLHLRNIKDEYHKAFFASAIFINVLLFLLFFTLLDNFSVLNFAIFLIISLILSRYIYPRISMLFKKPILVLIVIFLNSFLQIYIASFFDIHFLVATLLSAIFIPERYLKIRILGDIQRRLAITNNYFSSTILGVLAGLNIDFSVFINYDQIFDFADLVSTILGINFLAGFIFLYFSNIPKEDRSNFLDLFSSKVELSIIILLLALNFNFINQATFSLSIATLAILNLYSWYKFGRKLK
jgi:hypothetical protein